MQRGVCVCAGMEVEVRMDFVSKLGMFCVCVWVNGLVKGVLESKLGLGRDG